MTAGVTRAVLAALEMIELSPTELRPGPIGVTWSSQRQYIFELIGGILDV